MESVENENYKPPHAHEDGLERDAAVTEKLVAPGDGTKITFTTNKADGKDQNGDAKIEIQGVEGWRPSWTTSRGWACAPCC